MNALDKNVRSLILTIRRDRHRNPDAPYLKQLSAFCDDVRAIVFSELPLNAPAIRPQCKEFKKSAAKNICRPISTYQLPEAIAICLINHYFTKFFDCIFEDCSFAFRASLFEDGVRKKITHHDAFQALIDYRARHQDSALWVAECDIRKFYDTVNHTVIKKLFSRLVTRATRRHKVRCDPRAIRLFYSYLDSYKFNKTVWPLNDPKSNHFKSLRLHNGWYDWPLEELRSNHLYRSFNNAKIGIPQGGALSGLISNIVLHSVDTMVMNSGCRHLLYLRYCDDMILIHPDQKTCVDLISMYEGAVRELKLLPHPFVSAPYGRQSWDNKSKSPYKWAQQDGVPWVGFVGYEIDYRGCIRVRKKSLKKEMAKQYEVVNQVLRALREDIPRASNRTIEESVTNRLVQMAVGRVRLHNYSTIPNEDCWAGGFRLLNRNKYSEIQMRRLDASRNRVLSHLRRTLQEHTGPTCAVHDAVSSGRQIVFYGKPFSYFYHVLEKHLAGVIPE